MPLDNTEVKAFVAAISKQKSSKGLTYVVRSQTLGTISRYFFVVKIGGASKGMLFVKHLLNWLGNAAQGAAGAQSGLTTTGSAVSAGTGLAGKAGALGGLSGAFNEGAIAAAKDTGDEQQNRNLMHQLKGVGGLQLMGFFDYSGPDALNLWYGDPNSQAEWNFFLKLLGAEDGAEIGYSAKGTLDRDKKTISLRGKTVSY